MTDSTPETDLKALYELFLFARRYRSSKEFKLLLDFISDFRFYKPYNCMLVHIQRPGAAFVCPARRWEKEYGRKVKPGASPIFILQPGGPVMFVFDVSYTEPIPGALEIPKEVEKPFEVSSGLVGSELDRTILNAIRDGIEITSRKEGSLSAGSIEKTSEKEPKTLSFPHGRDKDGNQLYKHIPRRYSLLLNETLSREARYASLTHELGHPYCGHIGTPNHNWWPDRGRL